MNNSTFFRLFLTGAMLCIVYNIAMGQTASASGEFSLQGRLTTSAGVPISDGSHSLTANIYAKGSGQLVYTETDNIITAGGVFSSMIGANGNSKLTVDANTAYELGVKVDGEAEMSPRIDLASSIKSLTADLAADANTVAGFGISTNDNAKGNTLLVLNNQGKISANLIDSGVVTTINGVKGSVNIQGGGDISVSTSGNLVSLGFTGVSGSLNYPYTHTVSIASGAAFTLTNTMSASTASFINSGLGAGLSAQAATGSAISATSSGTANGAATIDIQNSGGVALNAVANTANEAVVTVKNTSPSASSQLVAAANANGDVVFNVASNGKTKINATIGDALDVTTSAAAEAALKVTGGIKLSGPVGVGVIQMGQVQVTINNPYVKQNSIILLTVNGGGAAAVPLLVAGQNNGSFVVSVFNGIAALAGNVSFSYLVINQ